MSIELLKAICLAFLRDASRLCFFSSSCSTRSNMGKYDAPQRSTRLAALISASTHASIGISSSSPYIEIVLVDMTFVEGAHIAFLKAS
ncbi:MAG: hypothetical protein JAZ11_00240 [Candidatus Thiodiazotropha lotti]|nr:hypothetical protein [Candidatus Thiodiazotropha lotti]